MMDTSAVTILFTPRLSRAPLTRPQVKARYCRQALLGSPSHTYTPPPHRTSYLRGLIQILFPCRQLTQQAKHVVLEDVDALKHDGLSELCLLEDGEAAAADASASLT